MLELENNTFSVGSVKMINDYLSCGSGQSYYWDNEYIYVKPDSLIGSIEQLPLSPSSGEEPAFKAFIGLSGTEDGFLKFAHKYGLLGGVPMPPNAPPDKKTKQKFSYWKETHRGMKEVHDIFQAIKKGDQETLVRFLSVAEIRGNEIIPVDLNSPTELIDSFRRTKNKDSTLLINGKHSISHLDLDGCKKGTLPLLLLAKKYISEIIQAATLTLNFKYLMQYDISLDTWRPLITPASLVEFLWYQLGEEVSVHRIYKACQICGEWEDLTGPKRRAGQWTQHPNCGTRAYMKNLRKKQAEISPPQKRGRPKQQKEGVTSCPQK